MREILNTRDGETRAQKHARLEDEHLSVLEQAFIDAESEAWGERMRLEATDGRTTQAQLLVKVIAAADVKVRRAQERLEAAGE